MPSGQRFLNHWALDARSLSWLGAGLVAQALFAASVFHPSHFLNVLVPMNELHFNYVGLDFYAVPAAAWEFLRGGSLAGHTGGNAASWAGSAIHNANVYHPVFTVAVGGLLQLLRPTTAAFAFQALSVALSVCTALWFYARMRGHRFFAAPAAFLLLAAFPQYNSLKIAQYQVLLNACLLGFLVLQNEGKEAKAGFLTALGLLVKPLALIFLPMLLLQRRTKLALVGFGVFAAISLPLLADPGSSYYFKNLFFRGASVPLVTTDNYDLGAILMTRMKLLPWGHSALKWGVLLAGLALMKLTRASFLRSVLWMVSWWLLFDNIVYAYYFSVLTPILALGIATDAAFRTKLALTCTAILSAPNLAYLLFHWAGLGVTPFGDITMQSWPLVAFARSVPLAILGIAIMLHGQSWNSLRAELARGLQRQKRPETLKPTPSGDLDGTKQAS